MAEAARACEEAGAAAITIHGRSREQRYQRAADWDLIGRVAAERGIPVVGNGDVLTHYEARERLRASGVRSLMLARGALIKPWLFREIARRSRWLPSAQERLALLWRFALSPARSLRRGRAGPPPHRALPALAPRLLRPLPAAAGRQYAEAALEHPLIHVRHPLGEDLAPIEALLRDPREETHARLADRLLDASSLDDLRERAEALAQRARTAERRARGAGAGQRGEVAG